MLHAWNVIFSFLAPTTAVQKKLVNGRSRKRLKHCATATGSFGVIAGESFAHTIMHDSCLQQYFKSVLEKSETKYQHDKKYVSKVICLNLGTPQTNFMCPFLSLYAQRRPWKPPDKSSSRGLSVCMHIWKSTDRWFFAHKSTNGFWNSDILFLLRPLFWYVKTIRLKHFAGIHREYARCKIGTRCQSLLLGSFFLVASQFRLCFEHLEKEASNIIWNISWETPVSTGYPNREIAFPQYFWSSTTSEKSMVDLQREAAADESALQRHTLNPQPNIT